jgi:hypothetical protein
LRVAPLELFPLPSGAFLRLIARPALYAVGGTRRIVETEGCWLNARIGLWVGLRLDGELPYAG